MKLNLTTGNVSADLLGFFFIKLWTTALDKSGLLKQPFTRQENTIIQTCVVATSGITFSGSNRPNKRTDIVIVPEELQLEIEKVICSDRESATAIAAATSSLSGGGKDENMAKTDMAVASVATLVAAQCVEAAEAMGAERDHLASVVSSAVTVRSAGDIMTLTAAAATALRGAATLKARMLKDVWNIAAVIPVDKGMEVTSGGENGGSNGSSGSFSGELILEENFLEIYSRELLARGCELLKRTRNDDLHRKIVSVYINKMRQVILKIKSRHVAGTVTKKKKSVVLEVVKDISAWPGRHLLEGREEQRYFALKTVSRGIVEFECRNQREYDIWTQGVSRLLTIAAAIELRCTTTWRC